MTTRNEKTQIRNYVLSYYSDRYPRNARITANGAVFARVQTEARTLDSEVIFCGWDADILREIRAIESEEAEEAEYRRNHA